MERLLYVALTRARHTLVLALDRSLFSPKTDRAADYSQLKFLRGDHVESSIQILDALPHAPNACPETRASWEEHRAAGDTFASELPPLSGDMPSRARARATEFIRKQNPSSYEELPEPPTGSADRSTALPPRSKADNAATIYGSWWHALFQHFPWTESASQWQTAFTALQSSSPDPDRSAREWKLFAKALPASTLAEYLARPAIVTHTELPFLWRMNGRSCVEGVIDLLLVDPAAGRALLIDWKTNRIGKGEEEQLRLRYRPQIAAYWKAVGEITGYEVEAGIFATATGEFIPYSAQELDAEWTRLRALPADQLSSVAASLWDA
jgi:ATP-dependent exoDNAse (exonuclease V) beta subunit